MSDEAKGLVIVIILVIIVLLICLACYEYEIKNRYNSMEAHSHAYSTQSYPWAVFTLFRPTYAAFGAVRGEREYNKRVFQAGAWYNDIL